MFNISATAAFSMLQADTESVSDLPYNSPPPHCTTTIIRDGKTMPLRVKNQPVRYPPCHYSHLSMSDAAY